MVTPLTAAVLSFQSGIFDQVTTDSHTGLTSWYFDDNSSITALEIMQGSNILYSAQLTDIKVSEDSLKSGVMTLEGFANLTGTSLSPAIVSLLGLPTGTIADGSQYGEIHVTFYAPKSVSTDTSFFQSTSPYMGVAGVSGGHMETPATVPIPPAALLLAPGLLGLVGIRKRLKG